MRKNTRVQRARNPERQPTGTLAAGILSSGSLSVAPTRDLRFLDSVVRQPEIWVGCHDDASGAREQFTYASEIKRPGVIFLRITHAPKPLDAAAAANATDLGFFYFSPMGAAHIVHTALLPNCRGSRAVTAGKLAASWMFRNTPTAGLASHCWETRPEVLWFAKRVGFEVRTQDFWPARINGARVMSTGVFFSRARWEQLSNINIKNQETPTSCPSQS